MRSTSESRLGQSLCRRRPVQLASRPHLEPHLCWNRTSTQESTHCATRTLRSYGCDDDGQTKSIVRPRRSDQVYCACNTRVACGWLACRWLTPPSLFKSKEGCAFLFNFLREVRQRKVIRADCSSMDGHPCDEKIVGSATFQSKPLSVRKGCAHRCSLNSVRVLNRGVACGNTFARGDAFLALVIFQATVNEPTSDVP